MSTLAASQSASALGALLVFSDGAPADAPAVKIITAALPAVIAAVVTAIGLVVTPLLNRSIAKRAPKTDMRARAYGDFIKYWMRRRAGSEDELDEILARLIVFGKDTVVSKVACLLEWPECDECFKAVVAAMRDNVKTSDDTTAMRSVGRILKRRRGGRINQPHPAPRLRAGRARTARRGVLLRRARRREPRDL